MAARTPTIVRDFSGVGKGRILVARFTEVDDGDTWAIGTAIGSNPLFGAAWIGNPATQASAGGHVDYASGSVTFYPSSDNLGCDLTVYI